MLHQDCPHVTSLLLFISLIALQLMCHIESLVCHLLLWVSLTQLVIIVLITYELLMLALFIND